MERNEQDIFDELVRQKLTGYTEPPEPAWIKNIHAKKNRVINLYHLYRLMLITALVGAGIFSSLYYFEPQQSAGSIFQPDHAITQTGIFSAPSQSPEHTSFAGISNGNTSSATTVTSSYSVSSEQTATTVTSSASTHTTSAKTSQQRTNASSQAGVPADARKPGSAATRTAQQHQQRITGAQDPATEKNERTGADNSTENNANGTADSTALHKAGTTETTEKTEAKETEVSCRASFDYYTSYNGEISFTNTSDVSSGASMTWTFGDGDRSVHTDPSHSFAKAGTYKVTLHVKDAKHNCEDSYTRMITLKAQNKDENIPVAISGILFAGGSVVKNGFVELYVFNEAKGGFEQAASVKTSYTGEFQLPIEKGKRYVFRGNPTSDHPEYAATFWGNTTEIENASDVMAMLSENKDLIGYNIDLQIGEKPVVEETLASGNPFEQSVLLLDANNNIVSVGKVDANGNFKFGDIAPGEYKVVNPATGNTTTTTIGTAGTATGNINKGGTTSAASGSGYSEEKVTVFPNPANTVVNFGVNSNLEERATIVIMNAGGVELSRESRTLTAGFNQTQYDLSAYPPGVYYVLVFKGNQQVLSNRLVKLSADTTK
jgi:PKD repeat protein